MNPAEIFAAYAEELRRQTYPGIRVESLPHFLRHTPENGDGDALVTLADLPSGREDAIIEEQISHFVRLGRPFEWKFYAFGSTSLQKFAPHGIGVRR